MKITIDVNHTLNDLKAAYAKHMGADIKKVKREDVATWLGAMVEADVDSVYDKDEEDD